MRLGYKYRTEGFIFKKENKGESDQIFSIFTRDYGRIEVNAKAIRKILSKLRANIDLFFLSEIEFVQGRNNKILTDAFKIKNFNSFYSSLEIFNILCEVSKCLGMILKGEEKDEKTYYFLIHFLDYLNTSFDNFKEKFLIFHYFFWNFLALEGYSLQFKKCVSCTNEVDSSLNYFSFKEGGLVCRECRNSYFKRDDLQEVNINIIKILRLILDKNFKILPRLRLDKPTQSLLQKIYQEVLFTFY